MYRCCRCRNQHISGVLSTAQAACWLHSFVLVHPSTRSVADDRPNASMFLMRNLYFESAFFSGHYYHEHILTIFLEASDMNQKTLKLWWKNVFVCLCRIISDCSAIRR